MYLTQAFGSAGWVLLICFPCLVLLRFDLGSRQQKRVMGVLLSCICPLMHQEVLGARRLICQLLHEVGTVQPHLGARASQTGKPGETKTSGWQGSVENGASPIPLASSRCQSPRRANERCSSLMHVANLVGSHDSPVLSTEPLMSHSDVSYCMPPKGPYSYACPWLGLGRSALTTRAV